MDAKYGLVIQKSFINNTLVEPGKVIPYEGPWGDNIVPCTEDGKPISKEAKETAEAAEVVAAPGLEDQIEAEEKRRDTKADDNNKGPSKGGKSLA